MVQMSIRLRAPRDRRPASGLTGPARVDRRTKDLTKRLRPGDIAVIDHEDLDRVSAEALVACKPAAVVNASTSISGRYPNLGPEILVAAGIPLLDHAGPGVMELKDGTELNLEDGAVRTRRRGVGFGWPVGLSPLPPLRLRRNRDRNLLKRSGMASLLWSLREFL